MRMNRIRLPYVLGAVAVLFAVAACSSDSDPATPGNEQPPAASEPDSGALVGSQEIEGIGTVLVDADGAALYTNEAESDGTVRCVDGCTDFWPPLEGSEDSLPAEVEGLTGELGVVTRPDGAEQVTLDGQPLYTFIQDQPGSVQGEGFEDDFQGEHFVWHVITLAGSGTQSPSQDPDTGGY